MAAVHARHPQPSQWRSGPFSIATAVRVKSTGCLRPVSGANGSKKAKYNQSASLRLTIWQRGRGYFKMSSEHEGAADSHHRRESCRA